MDPSWGLVIGGIYYGWTRQLQAAVLVGALVPSHWGRGISSCTVPISPSGLADLR